MKKGMNHARKETHTAKHIIIGILLFVTLQVIFIALTGTLILNNTVNEQSTNWLLPAITLLSAYISGLITLKNKEVGRFQTAITLTGILILIVMLISLALNGSIPNTWRCDACILIGIGLALLIRPNMKVRKRRRKVHL